MFEAASETLAVGMKVAPPSKDMDANMPCFPPPRPSYATTITSPREEACTSFATTLKDDTWKLLSQPTGFVTALVFWKTMAAMIEKTPRTKIDQRICRTKAYLK